MIQTQIYRKKLVAGESVSVASLEASDTGHTYQFHTIIFLGGYGEETVITIDGLEVTLPGAFIYNVTPVSSVSVTTSTHGVLLIGKKTKKTLFN